LPRRGQCVQKRPARLKSPNNRRKPPRQTIALDGRRAPKVALDDEPRALALLPTAYDRPVGAYVIGRMRRACDLWNEGEKALAHIHLAYASLPPCGPDQASLIFVTDELLEAGVTPAVLRKAQGFDPAPLALL
jgi:hypothetical protein